VRDKYPDLGAAVREAVHFTDREDAQTTLPRSEWWKRPTPEELAQHFPPEK
jgi:hypothetical protein